MQFPHFSASQIVYKTGLHWPPRSSVTDIWRVFELNKRTLRPRKTTFFISLALSHLFILRHLSLPLSLSQYLFPISCALSLSTSPLSFSCSPLLLSSNDFYLQFEMRDISATCIFLSKRHVLSFGFYLIGSATIISWAALFKLTTSILRFNFLLIFLLLWMFGV